MRKLKLQVQITLDGFISGKNNEMDWMIVNWSNDLKDYVTRLNERVDTILLGKNLALGFIPHWTDAYNRPEPMEGSEKYVKTPKVVFSKTLKKSEWDNTVVANGDLIEEVNKLKNQKGKDMIVFGGGKFVSSLIKKGLIDEYHLFINPVALGEGMPIFQDLDHRQNVTLQNSQVFECGIVVLKYKLR